MIGHPARRECVRNGLFAGRSAISPARRVDPPRAADAARSGHACGAPEQDLVRAVQIPVALEASLDAGVEVRGRAAIW